MGAGRAAKGTPRQIDGPECAHRPEAEPGEPEAHRHDRHEDGEFLHSRSIHILEIRVPQLDELARRWPEIAPILKRATARTDGCYEPIDVLQQAMANRVGFWLIEDGAELVGVAVGEIRQYPRKRVLDIPFLAGKRLTEWWPLFVTETDARAREHGCASITSACGRPGWSKFWAAHGVKVHVAGEVVVRDL